MPTNSTTSPAATDLQPRCAGCGESLPDAAQFCLKCEKSVSPLAKSRGGHAPETIRQPRPKWRIFLGILLAVLIGAILWAGTSDSPSAQQVQEFVGLNHDRVVLDGPFSIGPHTFRYYKFALPEGSMNVVVVGQFTCVADSSNVGNGRVTTKAGRNKEKKEDIDNNIEVYVLTDSAFTVWQTGYTTGSLYESGKVAEGSVQADVPAGAGVYYLVFSNKSAPKMPKSVHATVFLHYKSWLPEWFRRIKGRFWDWSGA